MCPLFFTVVCGFWRSVFSTCPAYFATLDFAAATPSVTSWTSMCIFSLKVANRNFLRVVFTMICADFHGVFSWCPAYFSSGTLVSSRVRGTFATRRATLPVNSAHRLLTVSSRIGIAVLRRRPLTAPGGCRPSSYVMFLTWSSMSNSPEIECNPSIASILNITDSGEPDPNSDPTQGLLSSF